MTGLLGLIWYFFEERPELKKIKFTRWSDDSGPVGYELRWHEEMTGNVMLKVSVEILRQIAEEYWVVSWISVHGGNWDRGLGASRNGLAVDLDTLFRAYQVDEQYFFDGDQLKVLSSGHHRKLVEYLTHICKKKKWNGNPYFRCGFCMSAYHKLPKKMSTQEIFEWDYEPTFGPDIWLEFTGNDCLNIRLARKNQQEEQRIQGVVAAACEKYGLDTEWEV